MDTTPHSPRRTLVITIIILLCIVLAAGLIWMLNKAPPTETTPQPMPSNSTTDSPPSPSSQTAMTDRRVNIVYIADGDNGQIGEKIGCDDSAVVISKVVKANSATDGALRALLADKSEKYGTTGLRNALWQSTLRVDSVIITGDAADVKLSGNIRLAGVCDNPRVKAQLEGTVKASGDASVVDITINGQTLDDVLSLK